MTQYEITKLLDRFISFDRFKDILNILKSMDCSNLILFNSYGERIYAIEENKPFCQRIKNVVSTAEKCQRLPLELLYTIKTIKTYVVVECHGYFLAFSVPLVVDDEVLGMLYCCQIAQPTVDYNSLQIEHAIVRSSKIIKAQKVANLEAVTTQIRLIGLCSSLLLDCAVRDERLFERNLELRNLLRFFKAFEEHRKKLWSVDREQLYKIIVQTVVEAFDANICSLMLLDEADNFLVIKAAIGLPEHVIKNTRICVGESIVGYVVKSGEPLLVKDITLDSRFKVIPKPQGRYYTKSLISAPIKIGGKSIGAINVNNEVTRRPFNEGDLNVLTFICEQVARMLC